MSIHSILSDIQKKLKAPKKQWNKFSEFHYRSSEDIQEAVKPLLPEGVVLTLSDDVVLVGDRIYIKATATLSNGTEQASSTAFAREALTKKGMDDAQITGSASSYARKYALNGLLLIDDAKDADFGTADSGNEPQQRRQAANSAASDGNLDAEIIAQMNAATAVPDLVKIMNSLSAEDKRAAKPTFDARMGALRKAA